MGPATLAQVLRPLEKMFSPNQFSDLLVGLDSSDDAAVLKISDEMAIIQTVDFFTPVVDDPYDFGSIAAANAMSDIYAMGGKVKLALNVCGFPSDMPTEQVSEILLGGAEKVKEAGGVLAGGHTVEDKEPKYGLSVLGTVHPNHIFTKTGAKAGDKLILTKPLGTGVITTASKRDAADQTDIADAVDSMKKLNGHASSLLQQVKINSCTDVTGFGLLGHALDMAQKSDVRFIIFLDKIKFINGAAKYAKQRLFPGGANKNKNYYKNKIDFSKNIPEEIQMLLFTPETSGGLLFTIPETEWKKLKNKFVMNSLPFWEIGNAESGEGIKVFL